MKLKRDPPNLFSTSGLAVVVAFNALVLSPTPTWAHVDAPTTSEPTDDVQGEAEQVEPPSIVDTPSPKEQLKTLDILNEHLQQFRVQFQRANERFDQLVEQLDSRDTSEAELRVTLALNDLQSLKQERDQIHRELRDTEATFKAQRAAIELGKSPPGDDVYKDFLTGEIESLEQQYERASKSVPASSPSLLRMKTLIEFAKNELERKSPEETVLHLQTKRDLLRQQFNQADAEFEKQQKKIQKMVPDTVDLMLLQDDLAIVDKYVHEAEREIHTALEALARTASLTEEETNAVGILSKQGYLANIQLAQKLQFEGRLTPQESVALAKIVDVLNKE